MEIYLSLTLEFIIVSKRKQPLDAGKRPSGGQLMTWQRNMKPLTKGLSSVGNVRLTGFGPQDPSHLWLETLRDMASRSQ